MSPLHRISFVRSLLARTAVVAALAAAHGCADKVATVEINPPKISLRAESESKTLTAEAKTADGKTVEGKTATWSSSDANIVKVDANGRLKAAGSGTAVVTAIIDEQSAACPVDVTLLKSLKLETRAVLVTVGVPNPPVKMLTANEKGEPIDIKGAAMTWKSADPNVATVGPDGSINGVAAGSTTVSVKLNDLTADVAVTVTPAAAPPDAGPAATDAGPATADAGIPSP